MLIRKEENNRLRVRGKQHQKSAKVRKNSTRGATNSGPQDESSFKWGRYTLVFVFLATCVGGVSQLPWQQIYNKTMHATNRPLANIKIEGEFNFVSRLKLQSEISSQLDGNFVDIDLRQIKIALEKNPWVKSVKIERIWPDSLKLNVNEQMPIARWNDNGFINREGQLITVKNNSNLAGLPLLSGEEANSSELVKNYVSFTQFLGETDLKINELALDKTMSWSIRLKDNFDLHLGRENIQAKLENFSLIYTKYLQKNKNDIAAIDMRYENGLAVQWRETSEALAFGLGR
ncbi:MAG: cell division protein FtsQ/DivIB [Agarilytica sp.]